MAEDTVPKKKRKELSKESRLRKSAKGAIKRGQLRVAHSCTRLADRLKEIARQRFEVWYAENYLKIAGTSSRIERAWEAYQAGSADMRERAAEVCETKGRHEHDVGSIYLHCHLADAAAIRSLTGSPAKDME